jgi:hypothetical protein
MRARGRAALAAFITLTALGPCGCQGRPTLAQACGDPSVRPAFVHRVLRDAVLPPFVTGVEYLDEETFLGRYPKARSSARLPAMVTLPDGAPQAPPIEGGRASRVIVLPGAFDCTVVQSELVFRLGLLEHEVHHARLTHRGYAEPGLGPAVLAALSPAVGRQLYDVVTELDAYRHEMQAARRQRGLPPEYYRMAAGAYLNYYLRLLDGSLPVPTGVRDELLRTRFEPWMLKQPVLQRDEQGWRFVLDGRRYELPPAVVAALRSQAAAAHP